MYDIFLACAVENVKKMPAGGYVYSFSLNFNLDSSHFHC